MGVSFSSQPEVPTRRKREKAARHVVMAVRVSRRQGVCIHVVVNLRCPGKSMILYTENDLDAPCRRMRAWEYGMKE
jgi:hypothetical protein